MRLKRLCKPFSRLNSAEYLPSLNNNYSLFMLILSTLFPNTTNKWGEYDAESTDIKFNFYEFIRNEQL